MCGYKYIYTYIYIHWLRFCWSGPDRQAKCSRSRSQLPSYVILDLDREHLAYRSEPLQHIYIPTYIFVYVYIYTKLIGRLFGRLRTRRYECIHCSEMYIYILATHAYICCILNRYVHMCMYGLYMCARAAFWNTSGLVYSIHLLYMYTPTAIWICKCPSVYMGHAFWNFRATQCYARVHVLHAEYPCVSCACNDPCRCSYNSVVAVRCSVLQCVAVCCSVMQCA